MSCSWRGAIDLQSYQPAGKIGEKIPLKVAIVKDRKLKRKVFHDPVDGCEVHIEITDELIGALEKEFNKNFQKAVVIDTLSSNKEIDSFVFVDYDFTYKRETLHSSLNLEFKDKTNKSVIAKFSEKIDKPIRLEGAGILLTALTILTCGLLGPIWSIADCNATGSSLKNHIETFAKDMSYDISNKIFNDDSLVAYSKNGRKVIVAQKNIPLISGGEQLAVMDLESKYGTDMGLAEGADTALDFGSYHALVIGNNDYEYVAKLNTAVNDARSVAGILQNYYGFNVKLILNGTRQNILVSLDGLRAKLTQNDNLLIYYAGHGYFDKEADRGYWLPVEAKDTTKANWISNIDITDTLKAIRAKHVLIVADSCYSGTLTRSINIKLRGSDYLSRISQKKSRTVLTAGGLEPVIDSGGGRHSVFAKAFLDILKENTGIMDGTLLFSKIRRPVMVNSPQTPQYSDIRYAGHDGGDFLFVKKKKQ